MTIVPGWHPMVVHFPLALVVTAGLSLSLARVLPGERIVRALATVGTWNLCLGAIAALFAIGTGLAAVIDLHVAEEARKAISSHVKAAMFTTLIVLFLAVWRGAGTAQDSRPSWLFVLVLWVATAGVIVTGYRGGQNVYRYGVGVGADGGGGVGVGGGVGARAGADPGAVAGIGSTHLFLEPDVLTL